MKKKKSSRVSIREVAKAAGISKAAAGFALQNKPEVSRATRERVQRIAARLGYAPDPRIASWMARVQETKTKEFQPIVWLNTMKERNAWHDFRFLSPYLEGAQEQARKLGYYIEELWAWDPGLSKRDIARILYQRGIEGVIISAPLWRFRLKWDCLAAVSIGMDLLAPRLHRVTPDVYFNFMLAIKMLKRSGCGRIGVCLDELFDRRYCNHAIQAAVHYFNATFPPGKSVQQLFYSQNPGNPQRVASQVVKWIRKQKPDGILCHHSQMVEWAEAAGYRVPEEIGVVHLAIEDDVKDWAGICSNKREIGAAAVSQVVSDIHSRRFGIPKTALDILVRGEWHPGRTLLPRKLK